MSVKYDTMIAMLMMVMILMMMLTVRFTDYFTLCFTHKYVLIIYARIQRVLKFCYFIDGSMRFIGLNGSTKNTSLEKKLNVIFIKIYYNIQRVVKNSVGIFHNKILSIQTLMMVYYSHSHEVIKF